MILQRTFLVLFFLLFAVTSLSQAGQDAIVSGTIITGYRVLQIDPAGKEINLTVYRGDYIKFRYPDTFAALDFAIPELKYKDTILANPEKSPFFKMKKTGIYSFTLGESSGKITVIELSRPNYQAVTADEAAKLLKNLHPFILDVRTPQEYTQLHIEGCRFV